MTSEKSPPGEGANTQIRLPLLLGFKTLPNDQLPLHTRSRGVSRAAHFWRRLFVVIGIFCLLLVLVPRIPRSCLLSNCPPITRNPAYLITADHGAVASENKRCSDIGVNVLKDGGNAVEAAISAGLCIGTVNMFSSGIGGGGFMTVRIPPNGTLKTSEVFTVDFRETAPKGSHKTMFVGNPSTAIRGGLAVAVPGELRGFEEAYRRWRRDLSWSRLVEPSAKLAAGRKVDAELARRISMYPDLMLRNEDWSAIFAPNGKLLRAGETIRNTNLSRTPERIATEGPGAFYKGPIADSIVHKVQETSGILTREDLEKYSVKVERALEGTYRNKRVHITSAFSSGPLLLHMLNLLERYDNFIKDGRATLNLHRIIEAMKSRTRVGDIDYYSGDQARVTEIPTKMFAKEIAVNMTDDCTHLPEYYKPEFDVKSDHGTTHIPVVDIDGMAVSLASTVNWVFGSRVLDATTGVILNDEINKMLSDNFPEPGKRPLSSTSPTITEYADGSFYLAIGASGGPQIFPGVCQAFLNLDWGMDASQAVEHGCIHDQLYPVQVSADNVLPPAHIKGLLEKGHLVSGACRLLDVNRLSSAVQMVVSVSKDGEIYAASDSRKNGIAAGY